MREVMTTLLGHWCSGETVALATIVDQSGSAPRSSGTAMVVTADGTVTGSLSGGCVEAAVYEMARAVLHDGRPRRERFGVTDDDTFAIGLTCGGTIDVFVDAVRRDRFAAFDEFATDVARGDAPVLATVVGPAGDDRVGRRLWVGEDGAVHGSTGCAQVDRAVIGSSTERCAGDDGRLLEVIDPCGTRVEVFRHTFVARPRMVVVGAITLAEELAHLGSRMGFHTTVCDARATFTTADRFPSADEVIVRWPANHLRDLLDAGALDENSAVIVLTHDAKFDVPALRTVLRSGRVGYVGAMGSRRAHADRLVRLREAGLTDWELAQLHSPIGLDLGARSPQETAISIAAEIVAARNGRSGGPLRFATGRLHTAAGIAAPVEVGCTYAGT